MNRLTTLAIALLPAIACAPRTATVGSPAPSPAVSMATNTRTIGSIGAPIGLQLWSLRSMQKDPAAMFKLARAMGVTHVETAGLYGATPEQFAAALKAADLHATSMHVGLDEFKNNPQGVIAAAKALGVKYVGTAWYPHQGAFTEADARKAIADFNAIGKTMKDAGLQFFYHNHGYEPVKYGDGTLLDLIIKETDPNLVKFEEDVLWTFLPGRRSRRAAPEVSRSLQADAHQGHEARRRARLALRWTSRLAAGGDRPGAGELAGGDEGREGRRSRVLLPRGRDARPGQQHPAEHQLPGEPSSSDASDW